MSTKEMVSQQGRSGNQRKASVFSLGFNQLIINRMKVNKLPRLLKQAQENIPSCPRRIHAKKTYKLIQSRQFQIIQKVQTRLSNVSLLQQRFNKKQQSLAEIYTSALIFGKIQYEEQFVAKYLSQLHQGLLYSTLVLGQPSAQIIKQKTVLLPQKQTKKRQKFLMLDLDETLIHVVQEDQFFQVELDAVNEKIRMNVRPFCQMFLQELSEHFQIYIFTSGLEQYAQNIVQYLNFGHQYIQGILSREDCLTTRSGVMIKDLRIIKNRDLSQIVIVDNLAHSFGLQIDNGIPILDFVDRKNDRELLGLKRFLLQLKDVTDVRPFLTKKLNLKKCCQIPEDQFVKASKIKNPLLRKRKTLF